MKKTYYIFQNGTLARKDNTIYFENDERKRFIPVEDIGDIYIFGEIDLNKRLLDFLAQKEVCLHFFNYHGYYTGTFYPREHLNAGFVVVKQAEHYLHSEKRLGLALRFVAGAIGQMMQVLRYYRNRTEDPSGRISYNIDVLESNASRLKDASSIEEAMAVEGHCREAYYAAFDSILNHPDFVFERRSKNPPLNRLNALISFGNAICYTTVLSEIYKTYLDPRIGFLHSTNFRRFTLNLDVAEIFKPIMVDRLIFTLINKRMISKKHFDKLTEAILLTEEGRKIFITELEKRMQTTVSHRHLGKSVSYRRLIRLELYKLQKHILGEKDYLPYKSLW